MPATRSTTPQTDTASLAVRAHVVEATEVSGALREQQKVALASADRELTGEALAALEPVGANNQPRVLQISAWICHAGYANRNGYDFDEAGLRASVESGLFKAPFVGMIDWNHDFTAIGAWHDAEFKYDPQAKAMGILAHGTIWSWRYETQANTLLAMQQRQGHIDVSVSCLFKKGTVNRNDRGGSTITIHDPVFLTTSVQDVDPADPMAKGTASEDVTSTASERVRSLLEAALAREGESSPPPASPTEDSMDDVLKKLEAMLGEHADKAKDALAPLVAAATELATLKVDHDTLVTAKAEADASVATLTVAKDEAETKLAASEVALAAAKESLATLETEVETLRAFKAEIDAQVTAKAQAEKREARLAEVPEVVKAALEKSEKKEAILTSWTDMSEEAWEIQKASFVVTKPTMADRSAAEGMLVTTADDVRGEFAIDRLGN